jgi:hypothetical protein
LELSVDGLLLLYVLNLSPKSYNHVEDDGLSFWCVVYGAIVCSQTSYCGDGEHGGNHLVSSLFRDTNLSFCCSYGCFRFSRNRAYCVVWSSDYGSLFATCSKGWTFAATTSLYTSS